MPDRTGRALGTLNPVIYFENASGHILLPPEEIGQGPVQAKRLYEERYRHQGYEWREAGTLSDVDRLQKRMVDQARAELNQQTRITGDARERARSMTNSNLRQRMASADCDNWERDFIRYWLELNDEKKKQFEQRFNERNLYLWARSKTRQLAYLIGWENDKTANVGSSAGGTGPVVEAKFMG